MNSTILPMRTSRTSAWPSERRPVADGVALGVVDVGVEAHIDTRPIGPLAHAVNRSRASLVARRGAGHDIVGQRRRRRLTVPARGLDPVAHDLLVEARRADADVVLLDVPEARRIGRQDLVDERDLAVDEAELELGVGQDDAALAGVVAAGLVDADRELAQLLRPRPARPARQKVSKSMFSSCPVSALVAGVNSTSSKGSACCMPARMGMPQISPLAW